MTTTVVYPDAHTESTTVDGFVYHQVTGTTWSDLRNAASSSSNGDSDGYIYAGAVYAYGVTNQWYVIARGIYLFNTGAVSAGDVISSVTFTLTRYSVGKTFSATPDLDVVASNPASNTAVATGDYDSLGTDVFGSISYSSFAAGANDISLSSGSVTKAGITKLGTRLSWDTDDSPPTWGNGLNCEIRSYSAEASGTTSDPKLTVVHEAPTGAMLTQSRLLQTALTGGRLVR